MMFENCVDMIGGEEYVGPSGEVEGGSMSSALALVVDGRSGRAGSATM